VTVDIVAAPLLGAEVTVMVEAVASLPACLAGEGLACGTGSGRNGERQEEDADHCSAASPRITSL
jgi:hypothetical protein